MKRTVPVLLALAISAACSAGVDKRATDEPLPDFNAMWDYDDPGRTEQRFRALLPAAEAAGDPAYRAELLTQIARTEGLQRRFEDAGRTLDTVEAMLTDDLTEARIRYLLERGRVLNASGSPAASRNWFLEAWERALQAGEDFYAVDAAHMLAIVEPPEGRLEWAERAIALAERSSDPEAKKWLGSLYNNTAWTYHDLGDYMKALNLFEKTLEWYEAKGDTEYVRISKWSIGRTYRSLGWFEEALALQRSLAAEYEKGGDAPDGYVYEEAGECLLRLGREEEARPWFARAWELLSEDEWLAAEEPERLARLKALGGAGD